MANEWSDIGTAGELLAWQVSTTVIATCIFFDLAGAGLTKAALDRANEPGAGGK